MRVLRLCHSNDAEISCNGACHNHAEYHAKARPPSILQKQPQVCTSHPSGLLYGQQQEGNGCNDPVKESNPTCETNLLVTDNLFVTGFVYRNVGVQMRKNVLKLLMQSSYTEATVACIVVLPLLLPRDFAKKIDHLNFHLFGPRVEFSLGKFKCEWFHGYPPTS